MSCVSGSFCNIMSNIWGCFCYIMSNIRSLLSECFLWVNLNNVRHWAIFLII
jgi:hypothetical protein